MVSFRSFEGLPISCTKLLPKAAFVGAAITWTNAKPLALHKSLGTVLLGKQPGVPLGTPPQPPASLIAFCCAGVRLENALKPPTPSRYSGTTGQGGPEMPF